jgi:Ala-tRNA(Pro) deacylase
MQVIEQPVYDALERLGIPYQRYEHPAVFTAGDAAQHWASIPALPCKNLFLRNKKGNREYLVILAIETQSDLQGLCRRVGDDRFSFGSAERLMASLGVTPGSVSPFALINNPSRSVRVIVDAPLRRAPALIFHPNINTASVTISGADLERFLTSTGHDVTWMELG